MYSAAASLSAADGFLHVKEGVDDMIKHLANEPSVGLYFVQQHAHASMPHLLATKENIAGTIHEVALHTEDIEDSICAVRSMAEFGLPIADEMIKDINKSLLLMSTAQPKRGLIQNPSWGFQLGKSSSTWDASDTSNGGSGRNYLSAMFNTAKQKASSLRWPQQPDITIKDDSSEKSVSSIPPESLQVCAGGVSTPSDVERDELPLSSQLDDSVVASETLPGPDISSMVESYNKFKEEQELKLQEWLQESEDKAGDVADAIVSPRVVTAALKKLDRGTDVRFGTASVFNWLKRRGSMSLNTKREQ